MSDSKDLEQFPVAGPAGEIVPYLAPKQRAALLDWVFREIGGGDGMARWAEKNDENRRAFYQMWAKGAARAPTSDDDSAKKDGIEKLLAQLDAGDRAVVVNGSPVVDLTPVTVVEEDDDV